MVKPRTVFSPHQTRPARAAPPTLAKPAAKLVGKLARKFGFADPRILECWDEIVGAELARYARPLRLTSRGGGVLTVSVANGAAAAHLQHITPVVLERINQFSGRRAVERLKIVQGGALAPARAAKPAQPAPPQAAMTGETTVDSQLERLRAHMAAKRASRG